MAQKYMGAKMLKKQIDKDNAKKAAMSKRTKGTVNSNQGEFIKRKTRKNENMSHSSVMMEGDFDI